MRVLVAPGAYRGTLTAREAADALAKGWLRAAPADQVTTLPLSDGGEGFVAALSGLPGARTALVSLPGPLGGQVPAEVLLVPGERGTPAYVEAAQACGPHLVEPGRRDISVTTSYAVGALVAAAVDAGARRVVVGVRELLCHDAGLGLWRALAGEPDERAHPAVETGSLDLLREAARRLVDVEVHVATPEELPLLGLQGAAARQAEEHGATPDQAQALESWTGALVAEAGRVLPPRTDLLTGRPVRVDKTPGAGAGGGVAWALTLLGARLVPAGALVGSLLDLPAAAASHDLLVTGEGRLDWASLRGRVVATVGEAAIAAARPAVVVPGQSLVGRRETAAVGISGIYPVADGLREVPRALADPAGTLAARAERVARTWSRA
ncbi:glycerate kinase [Arsenicicoccus dermatophilus]|uniref:glycerate kinase n=1 Tax=Arsenicicoccus dermatophilus TaxID=1076331 RepID=UPI001F4CECC8|nr:glycerate kinase [Arsenicicoccus dermatophilus]